MSDGCRIHILSSRILCFSFVCFLQQEMGFTAGTAMALKYLLSYHQRFSAKVRSWKGGVTGIFSLFSKEKEGNVVGYIQGGCLL